MFEIGETVRMKDIHPVTHTRLPQYVRGHLGTIELNHGCHVFPDSNAIGAGEDPHPLPSQRPRHCEADALARAGDDGDFSGELEVHYC